MTLPIEKWLENTWPIEKAFLKELPFLAKKPVAKKIKLNGGKFAVIVTIKVKVDFPAKGPVCDVSEIEDVCFFLLPDYPLQKGAVLLRHDFPPVPHLSSRKDSFREVCLTRRASNDWWCGKTVLDLAKDVYDWLCDAAAGTLIKEGDPFEPLIASGKSPVILSSQKALEECAKHEGIWETTSNLTIGKDGNAARFIVGKEGDIPTQVWYQEHEQTSLWLDRPSNAPELLNMMLKVGFDTERIGYWINKNKKLLLVVGIKRPHKVLGKAGSNEWVAFEMERGKIAEKSTWTIKPHLVLEGFSPSIARATSAFDDNRKEVIIIGAGALGSEIAEALARAGIVNITIIDNDRLLPHNLARHTLSSNDIGEFKADALVSKINSFFETDISNAIKDDFLELPLEKLKELFEKADCIIDCSASIAVQLRLSDTLPRNKPLFSGFQINAGKGTVFLYSPDVRVGMHNMLKATLATRFRDMPLISDWLVETGDTVVIGGGCSSVTSKISSGLVKFGAGWLSDKIAKITNSEKWPDKVMIELLENNSESKKIEVHNVEFGNSTTVETGDWIVLTSEYVVNEINKLSETAFPDETGGALIGRVDRQRKVIYITDAWKAPVGSYATRTGFSRGLAGLKTKIAMLEKDTNEYLSYVGEWHSHPPLNQPELSSIDTPTANRMAVELEKDRMPAVCLITNGKEWKTHVVEQRK